LRETGRISLLLGELGSRLLIEPKSLGRFLEGLGVLGGLLTRDIALEPGLRQEPLASKLRPGLLLAKGLLRQRPRARERGLLPGPLRFRGLELLGKGLVRQSGSRALGRLLTGQRELLALQPGLIALEAPLELVARDRLPSLNPLQVCAQIRLRPGQVRGEHVPALPKQLLLLRQLLLSQRLFACQLRLLSGPGELRTGEALLEQLPGEGSSASQCRLLGRLSELPGLQLLRKGLLPQCACRLLRGLLGSQIELLPLESGLERLCALTKLLACHPRLSLCRRQLGRTVSLLRLGVGLIALERFAKLLCAGGCRA